MKNNKLIFEPKREKAEEKLLNELDALTGEVYDLIVCVDRLKAQLENLADRLVNIWREVVKKCRS